MVSGGPQKGARLRPRLRFGVETGHSLCSVVAQISLTASATDVDIDHVLNVALVDPALVADDDITATIRPY
jgi:hypothetical protein